ncbi:GNAT family protein [Agromyces sp. G08B096]|uniref:GNAT family protein n=1 Tax=Agromyces sp. G08B096 TaxID=3156399 RepID=A0AAU7WAI0_9MICO
MTEVRLQQWGDDGLETLRRANTPEMTAFLGGPESEQALVERHARYLRLWREGGARMFRIVTPDHPEGVGSIGTWPDGHHGSGAFETGWAVEAAHQGRGIATAALLAVLDDARATHGAVDVYAYPRVENAASNAICRKAGFVLVGEEPFEYPKGTWARSSVWVHRAEDTGAGA